MLSQVEFWAERAGMLLDLVLLLRILMLKLPRTYIFITLFAVLSLLYDGVDLYLGPQSAEASRVWVLSRFVYAVVFPLTAWDLFEEAKPLVEKLRRLAMSRMISSLLFITLWGLLIAAFTGGEEDGQSHYLMNAAFVIWTGSVAAALAFLWVMRKGIKAGQLSLPANTLIWFRYFQLLLVIEAVSCAIFLILRTVQGGVGTNVADLIIQASDPILQVCAIVLTVWCVYKLRPVPSDGADVAADVKP